MGVPQIWKQIRDSGTPLNCPTHKRVPFVKWISENRDARIAIDVYHILFECGFFQFDQVGKPILNFVKRLKELVSFDVTFLLVFDGLEKPRKKGVFGGVHPKFMSIVEELLKSLNISYVMAPGEGEVQCCWHYKNGDVSYVWSNDSDCLIFGGDCIIKNYSKSEDDAGSIANQGSLHKDPYVTVLNYKEMEKRGKLLNRNSLLFFSALLGGDYNSQGVKGLGSEKALKLARLERPNFSEEFAKILNGEVEEGVSMNLAYVTFQHKLFRFCQSHGKEIFGKNYNNSLLSADKHNFENWPQLSTLRHYSHPRYDDSVNIDSVFNKLVYANVQHNKGYDTIDFDRLRDFLLSVKLPQIVDFDKWFHETFHEMFLLKYLLYDEGGVTNAKITDEKETMFDQNISHRVKFWRVRYRSFIQGVRPSTRSRSVSPVRANRSPERRSLDIQDFPFAMWIPQSCIPESHPLLIQYKEMTTQLLSEKEMKKKKRTPSPKKRFAQYRQSSNLDSFLSRHASPVNKNVSTLVQMKQASPLKSVTKRLFVEEDCEVEKEDGSAEVPDKEDDDSLVILEEVCQDSSSSRPFSPSTEQANLGSDKSSPKKHNSGATSSPALHIELVKKQLSFNEHDRNPIRCSTARSLPLPQLSRPATLAYNRESSLLDQIALDAEELLNQSDFDTSDTVASTNDEYEP
ncbi:crossover junction endodeoxyribonuclease KNAG_0D02840 [Huiozyma naganishii CBS 8797]|uniref:XPG-I domain-containing protein n=1 Tax=Huiozyma naganishii (strain ATCC MYA-139 / BCRC 22969 / CBS 8797 / KCTC 17520 / NBRC 10181 / NCYC 3082 / Yp74L-3) TaxID=1071383 RepID=J7RKL2_HUIN7|nr:hypothetical protein KNAG_0D02840 [Kazachstania naganishii CBS 8797]CCK70033.1 hypothetical protein KNAG_0D02840 [Kazachstania naganishii CBS 8797]